MRRVVVTGMGIVSSIGTGRQAVLESLREGRSGIRCSEEYRAMGFRSHVHGPIELDLDALIDRKLKRFMSDGAGYNYLALREAIGDAALVLVDARDAEGALPPEDAAILARLPAGLPRVVVHNKVDLAGMAPRRGGTGGGIHVWISALSGAGMDLLEREVLAAAGVASVGEDTFIARARHVEALRDAAMHLAAAAGHIAAAAPALELFAEELREAQDALSSITGEFTADDLLGVIFSRFCIGK